MREQGSTDIRFSDIARAMSMTAPGLYRYFSGRDELITALVSDAFAELADELEKALVAADPHDPTARVLAVCQAYREWGTADRTRFALVFGLPVPGYVAPDDGPQCDAADRAFAILVEPVRSAVAAGIPVRPTQTGVSDELAAA